MRQLPVHGKEKVFLKPLEFERVNQHKQVAFKILKLRQDPCVLYAMSSA
jgi:hypothetical protein